MCSFAHYDGLNIVMEKISKEPEWLTSWRRNAIEIGETLPEAEVYPGGIKSIFSYTPSFDGNAPTYQVVSIEKELELYTLKEAYETLGISDLLGGLLASPLLPQPHTKVGAEARAKIASGLLCYIQPKIDAEGHFVTQKMSLLTTLGQKSAADIFVVIAKTGARVEVAHAWKGGVASSVLYRTLIVLCEEGAEVNMVDAAIDITGALAVDRIGIVGSNARIDWREDIAASSLYFSHNHNLLVGNAGKVNVEHVLLAANEAQYDISVDVELRAEGAESIVTATGAAASGGHIIYRSNTISTPNAAAARGVEQAKFLLLDESARIDAVPALLASSGSALIEHKLAVTHIKDEEVFYATAKGLGAANARVLAAEGFFAEAKPLASLLNKLVALVSTLKS